MATNSPIKMTPVSSAAWHELLAPAIPPAGPEPRIRRRSRRCTVQLGACCILYLKGRQQVELRVKLLNASLDGVMVLSRVEVPVDCPVAMSFNGDEEIEYVLLGDIVHCTSTIGGYKVGIRLRFPLADDPAD